MKLHFPLLPLSAILLTSCGRDRPAPVAHAQAAATPVHVFAVHDEEWPSRYEATGTVRARTTATISSKLMGYVQQAGFQVGDRVREGQVLVVIEARDLDANVRRAEAARAEVRNSIPEMESAIAAAKANLDLAQATFERMSSLAAKKSISNQEFDEAGARLKAAESSHQMARSRRSQLDSRMEQADQEVSSVAIMRDYTKITAPFNGIVTAKSVEAGNLATPGAPLLSLEREGSHRLEAAVDESKLSIVKAGQPVEVQLDAGRKIAVRVSEIAPSVDASSRSYLVKIDLPSDPQMRSGMFGRAVFALGTQPVVAIPSKALVERGQLQSVLVVENGQARTRLVTTGSRRGESVEVLSGLTAGETIALDPRAIEDGAKVEVRK